MIRVLLLLVLVSFCGAPDARSASTECPGHFARGRAPDLVNDRLQAGSIPLCFEQFAVLHSARTRTPLYSAEHLSRMRLEDARQVPRRGEFHAEPRLPPGGRAELADYARSGFDRGHMAPSGDMPDLVAQQESFSLANMVPQNQQLNRGLWEQIERAVRRGAERRGSLFVVTGPAFRTAELESVGNVIVPTHVWKAVHDPARGTGAAYVAANDESGSWQTMSIADLAAFTGIDVFPGMTPRAKARPMRLPPLIPFQRGGRG